MATHFSILAWKIPWTEEPVSACMTQGGKELDRTEQLHFHFHFSLGLEVKLIFSSPGATAEFSKFAGIRVQLFNSIIF